MSALSDNSSDGMPANLQNADLQNGNRRSGEYSSDGYPASATDRASQTSPLRQQIRPQSAQQVRQPQNRRAQITLTPDVLKACAQITGRIRTHLSQGLIGQEHLRESLITALTAGGHILIESVPGLAKTTASQLLATAVSGSFRRIQCTPDLMPSDLTGTEIFDFSTQKMTAQIGPIHANFVLLDEINRSGAKTQSAMLEAMAEGATTIGGKRIELPKPFMVIATQNPIEEEGTYNLPEAQADRFMMKTVITYPSHEQEVEMLSLITQRKADFLPSTASEASVPLKDLQTLQACAKAVHVSKPIADYVVSIVETSRGKGPKPIPGLKNLVRLGASPRASIALIRAGQAQALMKGRDYVIPEDIRAFMHDILRHRILLTFEAAADGITADRVTDAVIKAVPVP